MYRRPVLFLFLAAALFATFPSSPSYAATSYDPFVLPGHTPGIPSRSPRIAADSANWSYLAPMPTPRAGHSVEVIDGKIYAAGGWDGETYFTTLERYDPDWDIWAPLRPMPTGRSLASSAVIDGKLYVAGGANTSVGVTDEMPYIARSTVVNVLAALEMYDPATDSWTRLPDMPSARYFAAGAAVGGKLHVVGGWDGATQFSTHEAYDPATNTWDSLAPTPQPVGAHAAIGIGGYLYVIGGSNPESPYQLTTVWRYDPATDSWEDRASLPVAQCTHAVAMMDGKVHSVGGWDGAQYLPLHQVYDPATDSWTSLPPMPEGLGHMGAAAVEGVLYLIGGRSDSVRALGTLLAYGAPDAPDDDDDVSGAWMSLAPMPTPRTVLGLQAIDGKLYAVGGWNGMDYLTTLEQYDAARNVWTRRADMPTGRSMFATGVIDGKLYVVGGYNTSFTSRLERYDPATDTWTRLADAPTARYGQTAGAIGGKLYVVNGTTSTNLSPENTTGVLECYDPATDTWTTLAPIPVPVHGVAAAVFDGALYITGGNDGARRISTVQRYDPATNSWSERAPMPVERQNHAVAVIDGKIHTVGGWDGVRETDLHHVYDPVADQWAILPDIPSERGGSSGAAIGNTMYLAGGRSNSVRFLSSLDAFVTGSHPGPVEVEDVAGVWTKAESPYRVSGPARVPAGQSLTIEPGVDVLFDAGAELVILGQVRAVGTAADSIRFLRHGDAAWNGLNVSNGGQADFAYARFSGGYGGDYYIYNGPIDGGGGLMVQHRGTKVHVSHSVFRGNTSRYVGGALVAYAEAELTVESTLFEGNSSVYGGGAVSIGGSTLGGGISASFTDCVFRDNTVTEDGGQGTSGAVLVHLDGDVTFTRCLFARNSAYSGGGAVTASLNTHLTLMNCTVANNVVINGVVGGVWAVRNSTVALRNTIVRGNAPDRFGGTEIRGDGGSRITATWSDIGPAGDPWPGEGNIDADPLFADTISYALSAGSPCIDAGDPDSPNDPDGSRADMGAYPSAGAIMERLVLPKGSYGADDEIVVRITGTLRDVDGIEMAFLVDSSVLRPDEAFIHARPNHRVSVFANMVGDTVFVSLAADAPFDITDAPVIDLSFRLKEGAPDVVAVPLIWLPYPMTNAAERSIALVDGRLSISRLNYGDVSGDGSLTAYDASMVLRYLVRLLPAIDTELADVSANGYVSSHDAALVMQKVLDPTIVFPAADTLYRLRDAGRTISLSWVRSGSAWCLVADNGDGLASGDISLRMPTTDHVRVVAGDMFAANLEDQMLRVAFVRMSDDPVLLRIDLPLALPPAIEEVRLNEGLVNVRTVGYAVPFALAQNVPNPFNPGTTIPFSLSEPAATRLDIYALNGQLIRTLIDAPLGAGVHEATWDGTDAAGRRVASGVYLYRLVAGQSVRARRMEVIR